VEPWETQQVDAISYNDWLIWALVFLLGLVIGMALMAGGKWKRRYQEESRLRQEEIRRREALEAQIGKHERDEREMGSLRHAAARDETRRRDDGAGPL
jgi:hypothetical protein